MEKLDQLLPEVYAFLAKFGWRILGALVIFLVGRLVARWVSQLVEKALIKTRVDETLAKFAKHLTSIGILVFVVIAALNVAGVKTTEVAVALGAAALAVGLALQGSLANFASGFLMIVFRPFKVGDLVEAAGVLGTVEEIQIFNTIVNTPDNVRVIIPNGNITGANIKNYTANGTRRVDLVVGVSYEDDLRRAKEVIEQVLGGNERILKDPAPTVAVSELGDSSVNFVVRPWVKPTNYWDVYFGITAKIKIALDENGISIPYPQRDVHIKDNVGVN
ncbi:MAG: mechanosensitive ion channel family protein [Planctomycetota bacterium]|jgi:small conductance mechanosensitive channel